MKKPWFYRSKGAELAKVMHETAATYGEGHGMVTLDYCIAAAILFYQASVLFAESAADVEETTIRMGLAMELAVLNELVKKNEGITLFHDITSTTLNKLFGVEYVDFLDDKEKEELERILKGVEQ